jgi:hypothetical protein
MSLTAIAAATSLLAACGGGGSSSSSTTIQGKVAVSSFTAGSITDPTIAAAYYKNAKVCVDANNNGKCDASENPVATDANGAFSLPVSAVSALIADMQPGTVNTASGTVLSKRIVFRISQDQVSEQGNNVVISPLSAEVARLMDANGSTYATEKQNVATRIGVPVDVVLTDVNKVTGANQAAMLSETHELATRFAYATMKLDRGDLYPDALAVPGGDPRLTGLNGVTPATATTAETRAPITFAQSQQAAFNIEGVPRYDHIFIVMLENKATSSIKGNALAPKINAYLNAGNQLTSYFATGNPSEPNYTALGGADDFGIVDDNQWNCAATGANAPTDLPLPDSTQPGLANSPFLADPDTAGKCTTGGANHNIVGKPNLFNALAKAGMTWRTYNESMNPGQDFRIDSIGDAAVSVVDRNNGVILPLPAQLYRTKHHPGMAYQNVRSAPEWLYSNRTLGGGAWDSVLLSSNKYPIPAGYNIDQFGSDLNNGKIGNVNFVVPDQCDDMHGITVNGTGGDGSGKASDCSSVSNNVSNTAAAPIIARGDAYVDMLVKKIEASPLWNNPQKRVAIVLMFDEGNASSGINSCCGWNAGNVGTVTASQPLNPDGTPAPAINKYGVGNHGHGESIFGILTNQAGAPKGVVDSDAYSHFSFVRTLQDMFGLADPADDSTYMNRSKYTEKFIADNILNLPEYAGSADTHFDSVRPINHAFVIPATYTQKQSADVTTTAQVGADLTQKNVWAIK